MPGTVTARSWSSWRGRIAVGLLAAAALGSGIRFAVHVAAFALDWQGPDEVTGYEERFHALRRLLPAHGVVGYLSDRQDAVKEFYMTQYVLAPLVVVRDARGPLVVGNFFDPDAAPAIAAAHRLTPIQDFGEGVVLFRGPGG